MQDERPLQGDLQRFEASYSAEGLFARYARGRVATFWTRQLFPLAGALTVALLIGPAIALLALIIVVASEAIESLILRRLLRLHPDGRLPGRIRLVPVAATLVQAIGIVAALWLLSYNLEDPTGHAVLTALLAGAALNAGLTIGHAPKLGAIRLAAYGCGAAAIVATKFFSGLPVHVVVNEIMAMFLAAQLLWLAIADLRRGFDRRVASQRELLQKSVEVEEARRSLTEREAEGRRLALVARHASDSMFLADNDYRIGFVNETFTRRTGYVPEEVIGKDPRDLFAGPNTEPSAVDRLSAAIRDRRSLQIQIASYSKDGREIWVELSISPLVDEDGRPDGFINVSRDVTQAKRREAELHRLSLVAQHANDGVLIADQAGSIEYVNRAFVQMTGLRREQLIGRKVREFFADPDTDAGVRERISDSIRNRRSIRAEILLLDSLGERKWVECNITPLLDGNGELAGHVNVSRDISEAKRRETELAEAKAVAEEALQAKTRFLATMSHEIRTPLNGIIGTADLLATTPLDGDQSVYVDTLVQSGEALLTIVNDILEMTRLEDGRVDLVEAPFDAAETVEAVIRLMRPAAEGKGLRIKTAISPELPQHLAGDAGRLRQILLNLTGNAIKFTECGEILLSARLSDDDGLVEFAVADSGIGIAPDRIEAVFESFAQEDSLTSRRFGGTGLGLTISRMLARAMGGDLVAVSVPAQGSTFTVRLPLHQASAAEAEPSPVEPSPVRLLPGRKILVAEDNKANRFLISRFLADLCFDVRFAEDGRAAVEAFAADCPDVILMDVSMPVMDGLAATREIRRLEQGAPPCPILGVTANAFEEDRKRCMEAGMTGFVSKPVRRVELLASLAEALREAPCEAVAAE